MHGSKFVVASLISMLVLSTPVFAKTTSLDDLKDLPPAGVNTADTSKTFTQNHWAYKTLQNVSKKYGLLIGAPGEKFDGKTAITRNEAAVLLVNLLGKIDQDNLTLSESEKAQIEILQQELKEDVQKLAGRVDKLETSVDSLQGRVTKVESDSKNNVKFGFGDSVRLTGAIQAKYTGQTRDGADNYTDTNFSFPTLEMGINAKLNKSTDFRLSLLPTRSYPNEAKGYPTKTILGDVYVASNYIPHHTVYIGQTRVPIGVEGSASPYTIDTIDRAQIAKKFNDTRDMGIKVAGKYTYLDYYLGAYNGNRNQITDTNKGMDLMSWVNVKPLAKKKKYGSLDLGVGSAAGKDNYSYNVTGMYAGYKLGKWGLKYEYATSKGVDGTSSATNDTKASGYYITGLYDLTKKVQLVAKFDTFDPNRHIDDNNTQQYTAGLNYFLRGNNLKFQTNYVFVNNPTGKDSQRIMLFSQYVL